MWQKDNSHVVHQSHHQYRFSVDVWAGIVDNYPVEPYLLPSHLIGSVYEVFLRGELPEDVLQPIYRRMWFQHDGDPANSPGFCGNI